MLNHKYLEWSGENEFFTLHLGCGMVAPNETAGFHGIEADHENITIWNGEDKGSWFPNRTICENGFSEVERRERFSYGFQCSNQ